MRTTFGEMHSLNYASQKHYTTFILNGKEWGVGKMERERERKRKGERCSVSGKSCGVGHKLDRASSIYEGLVMG